MSIFDLGPLREDHGARSEFKHRLIRGMLPGILLVVLKDEELSGYQTIGAIHRRLGILLSPGTVYPNLEMLVRRGLLKNESSGRRGLFGITPEGRQFEGIFWSSISEIFLQLRRLGDGMG